MIFKKIFFFMITAFMLCGCFMPKNSLFTDNTVPLKEYVLQGEDRDKILLIPVKGIISDMVKKGLMRSKPSMVQEIVSQLKIAEKDEDIKAVLFKIDSPGGTVTASDILYHEIKSFKERTKKNVIVCMMGVAASGGYYISLPADYIMAHPTTITGSIGVIYVHYKISGLLDKLGIKIDVDKSGKNKDMGSPFRNKTEEEKNIFNTLNKNLSNRFMDLVIKHRNINKDIVKNISTARIYLADEALEVGLIDEIGYLSDAVKKAKIKFGLSKASKVVVYRRNMYPEDNIYNNTTTQYEGKKISLINFCGMEQVNIFSTGFYYLWSN